MWTCNLFLTQECIHVAWLEAESCPVCLEENLVMYLPLLFALGPWLCVRAAASFPCGGNNESDGMAADAWMSISEILTAGKPLRQVLSVLISQ